MGSVLMGHYSNISFHYCNFMHNTGQKYLFWMKFSNVSMTNTSLVRNSVAKDDILIIINGIVTEFQELCVRENRGNIKLMRSKTNFSGEILYFNNNGSIISTNSFVYYHSDVNLFMYCRQEFPDEIGGIVRSDQSTLHFYGITYFFNNNSSKQGGAMFMRNSKVHIHKTIIFDNNMAQISGGGIYLYKSELYCHLIVHFLTIMQLKWVVGFMLFLPKLLQI